MIYEQGVMIYIPFYKVKEKVKKKKSGWMKCEREKKRIKHGWEQKENLFREQKKNIN